MSVRPLIGCQTTPFFNLAPASAASSPPTPPPYILHPPDSPIPCPVCKVVDNYETIQCIYCREELPIWHLSCVACVDAYDTTFTQHFCESDHHCRSALNTGRIRRDTWLALNKQGESMIESSRKRFCKIEIGNNVRVAVWLVPQGMISERVNAIWIVQCLVPIWNEPPSVLTSFTVPMRLRGPIGALSTTGIGI